MPSPEEFAQNSHGVGAPPNIEALKARARQIRQAQAAGRPIPEHNENFAVQQNYTPVQPNYEQVDDVRLPTTDEELELVRTRFKLASFYEALLEQPVFGDDTYTDPYANLVQNELTEWVKGRMSELVGIRNNPEGFTDEDVHLLRNLAQGLGSNGVKALILLANRMVNPPQPTVPVQALRATVTPPPAEEPVEEEDSGGSAMSLFSAPTPEPAPAPKVAAPTPQVTQAKSKTPRVRRAKLPGGPACDQAQAPQVAKSEEAPQGKRKKLARDPLASVKALAASRGQVAPEVAPQPQQAAPAAPFSQAVPVPMPKGLNMTCAMEAAAGAALTNAKVIEATGGGVF